MIVVFADREEINIQISDTFEYFDVPEKVKISQIIENLTRNDCGRMNPNTVEKISEVEAEKRGFAKYSRCWGETN